MNAKWLCARWGGYGKRDILFVIFLLSLSAASIKAQPSEMLYLHADRTLGAMPLHALGFLHGVDEQALPLDDSLVASLRPQNWRLYKFVSYELAARHNPTITYGLSNHYAWSQGGFPNARPWEDWEGYEQYIANELAAIYYYFPDNKPAFFDIWNEPDLDYFWSGTYEQLLELFARCWNVVNTFDPEAKLVGPSVAKYRPYGDGVTDVVAFLEDLDALYDIRLDAVSWHENESANYGGDLPERIPQHAWNIRMRLANSFPPEYQPELHVNEYAGNQVHLSPGWNVGYLYYLIEAPIDAAMRACWWVYSEEQLRYDLWCDCWNGLNAMFMNDGTTPQHSYWIYKAYADMTGCERIETESPSTTTNILACRDDANETLRIIVGRYHHGAPADVVLQVGGYPYEHESVLIRGGRIPHYEGFFNHPYPTASPLPGGPVETWKTTAPLAGGVFEIEIGGFADNDAYLITVTPDETVAIDSEGSDARRSIELIASQPNPFYPETMIRLFLPREGNVSLCVYDPRGRQVAVLLDGWRSGGEHDVAWDGKDDAARLLPAGTYFLKLEAAHEAASTGVILVH